MRLSDLPWLGLSLLLATADPVRVRLLESHHPQRLQVGEHALAAAGDLVQADGAARPGFELPAGRWSVRADGAGERSYDGALSVTAKGGELAVTLAAPLESYVAGVVAAESLAGTPRAALEALAVVARSYALATHSAPLCDLAHCQIFRGTVRGPLGDQAREATRATEGRVLKLADGSIAAATFGAACGGHTADPREVFGGDERTGARAVADLDPPTVWTARVSETAWRTAVREAFNDPLVDEAPTLVRGAGGRIVQLILSDGRRAAGDAFVRALDRGAGRGVIQSSQFELHRTDTGILITGSGHGHGVGLCQAGAALRAARGEGYAEILKAYFPAAAVAAM